MDKKIYDLTEKSYYEPAIAKLKALYDEVFLEKIDYTEDKNLGHKRYYYSSFSYLTLDMAIKLLAPCRDEPGRTEGMLGVQGGFKKGDRCAVLILEAAYRLEERLLPKLVKELEPEIKEYVSQKVEGDKVSEAVREEKDSLREYFTYCLETKFQKLSDTERMVPRECLEKVCKKTEEYFSEKNFNFKERFPELEERYSDEFWEINKKELAVVKYAIWELMISHLGWKDTENGK